MTYVKGCELNHVNVLRFCHPVKEMVILNREEQKRLVVLNQVEVGKMTGKGAAEVLGFSLGHVRGILAAYREDCHCEERK